MSFRFEILKTSKKSKARVGRIITPHGVIDTPHFVAVGTNATVKALDSKRVDELNLQLLFCNTYHLLVQDSVEAIEKAGGLHQFMGRSLPLITDSGGFQVFSLAYGSVADELKSKGMKKQQKMVLKIDEEGVTFRSYRDGKKIHLSAESSVEIQKKLGADIIIPFDELPPYHVKKEKLKESLERTHRWEKRSLDAHKKNPKNQAMYGVVHGGIDPEFRKKSCMFLTSLDFEGFAIGGSVGKNKEEMHEMLQCTLPNLPEEMPKHLLGMGDLESLMLGIPLGIDTFDSSFPTKAARHGLAFSFLGSIKLFRKEQSLNFSPIEEGCDCWTCRNYTRAYLYHLFQAREIAALTLTTIHNLHFMARWMQIYREKILRDEI